MRATTDTALADAVRVAVHPLTATAADHERLLASIGDARLVLLGGATYGTAEFYRDRAEVAQWLIAEKGFGALAVEADSGSAERVDRYVRPAGDETGIPVSKLMEGEMQKLLRLEEELHHVWSARMRPAPSSRAADDPTSPDRLSPVSGRRRCSSSGERTTSSSS